MDARTLLVALAMMPAIVPAGAAQTVSGNARSSEIRGQVVDTAGLPIAGAQVRMGDGPAWLRTDEHGEFRSGVIAAGEYMLLTRAPGFLPDTVIVRLSDGEVRDVRVVLRPFVAALQPMTVTEAAAVSSRHEAFDLRRRRQRVGAQFITHEEIERRAPLVTTDLLRRMQGFKVYDSAGVSVAVSTRGPKPTLTKTGGSCVLRVGVDGTVYSALAINSIPPADIHGIEVYTGANIPPEFSSGVRDSYCGLIMIWTR